jgi:hypothetical protein
MVLELLALRLPLACLVGPAAPSRAAGLLGMPVSCGAAVFRSRGAHAYATHNVSDWTFMATSSSSTLSGHNARPLPRSTV